MLKKNDIIELTVTDLTDEGFGVAKYDGYVLFIPKVAVGDVIKARVLKTLTSHGFAKAEEIISPAPCRKESDCPSFTKCGGCLFRHITYESELHMKKSWVDANFKKIAKLPIVCDTIVPSPSETRYRNKAQIPCAEDKNGNPIFGFYASHSHRVIEEEDCKLQPAFYKDIVETVKNWMKKYRIAPYNEETGKGILRHVFIRDGRVSKEVMVTLIATVKTLPHAKELVDALLETNQNITSIILNVNTKRGNEILGKTCITLYGNDSIQDTLCGLTFRISPLSFYQVNHDGAEVLYGVAKEFADLQKDDILLDLYCGVGTIGLSMARDVKTLIGVEVIPEAIENAKKNAAANGIDNAAFFAADAGEAAKKLAKDGLRPTVIVVDPPRKGCSDDVIEAIDEMAPKKVVMVSCNSATAARDCAKLYEKGYTPVKMRAVDMFPGTGHVEAVISLVRS